MANSASLYKHYQEWKSWEQLFVCSADQAGYFAAELADLKISGADVLEIGFGAGSCVAWMEERGARVSVTEISERSCSAARAHGLAVLPSDLPSVAKANDGRFDTILAFDVFEHLDLETVDAYIDACATMLKPGGKLLLRFPNAQSPFGLKPQAGDPTHQSHLSLQVLELLVVDQPLYVTRYQGSYLYLGKPLTLVWLKRLIRRVCKRIISQTLNFVYASGIPYDPVVVAVLRKAANR